jgi:MoxR-like ATPase
MELKYQRLLERVLRENEEHGEYLRWVQWIIDGDRLVIVKQKAAVTYIVLGLITHGPQKAISEEAAKEMTEAIRMGVCAHVSLEGNPGRAKTVLCESTASQIKASWARIQCTVDLEPSGVLGSEIINPVTGIARYRKGPIFNNIILADEINRAMPKTQAAFLEAMPEGQVSRDVLMDSGETVRRTELLPRPFFVVATQNPIEQEGTFPMPEAQRDRFAFQVNMTGIGIDDIVKVASLNEEVYCKHFIEPVITPEQVLTVMQFIHKNVYISPLVERYSARLAKSLVFAEDLPKDERENDVAFIEAAKRVKRAQMLIAGKYIAVSDIVSYAMYERMAIISRAAARSLAFMRGRRYVLPQDVRKVFRLAARHRIFLKPLAEGMIQQQPLTAEGRLLVKAELIDMIIDECIRNIPIPFEEPAYDQGRIL